MNKPLVKDLFRSGIDTQDRRGRCWCPTFYWARATVESACFLSGPTTGRRPLFRRFECKHEDGSSGRLDFQSRPERVTCTFAMSHFHEPAGLNDFDDPATWDRASYTAHPIDSMEPLSDEPNPYRQAALRFLGILYAVDEFLTAAPTLGLPLLPSPSH
jgi:hypothetical protein